MNQFIDSHATLKWKCTFHFIRSLAILVLNSALNCFIFSSLFKKYEYITLFLSALQSVWWKNGKTFTGNWIQLISPSRMKRREFLRQSLKFSTVLLPQSNRGVTHSISSFAKAYRCFPLLRNILNWIPSHFFTYIDVQKKKSINCSYW